jgi:glutathione S-transferase
MVKIYGSPRTSASRCYLLLEELDIPYQVMPVDLAKGEQKAPEYMQLNPNAKVPALVDGDKVLWESCAINYYLAEKYKPELLGKDSFVKAKSLQWSFWMMLELQTPLVEVLIQKMFVPEEKRDLKVIEKNSEKIPNLLKILDTGLEKNKFIAGDEITVADFNITTAINMAVTLGFDLSKYPQISKWFGFMKETKGFQKLMEKRK